jgi:hypothetical protein
MVYVLWPSGIRSFICKSLCRFIHGCNVTVYTYGHKNIEEITAQQAKRESQNGQKNRKGYHCTSTSYVGLRITSLLSQNYMYVV